ncbi:MAG: hypothetical protein K2O97_12760 [Acetatifactor sp.]|nr:hypothetical protein [Acetatifactor sp.]MDE7045855.1 hypothetical protein [Acetatifactor sp.]
MVTVMKMKRLAKQCFEGDVTMPKVILWLICIICALAGIVYGLCAAPLTHGITIGSNNINYDDCIWGNEEEDEE